MTFRHIVSAVIIAVLAFLIGKYLIFAPFSVMALLMGAVIALITLQNPGNGLLVLVFSMMLSPEITVANVPGRPVTIRVDDLLIITVFMVWMAGQAVTKEWKGFTKTPLDKPLVLLVVIYFFSTSFGILFGGVNPIKGFFYSLKYVEYFMLYWLTANVVRDRASISRYLFAGLITCLIVTAFAYSLMGKMPRVYAPFDSGGGEPASLGGYYLIVYAILFGFFMNLERPLHRWLILGVAILITPPFIRTLSRASYLAFIPMALTLGLFAKRRKAAFLLLLAFGAVLLPVISQRLYTDMVQRVMITFQGTHSREFDQIDLASESITDQSALERIQSWDTVLHKRFTKNILTALLGSGVTGIGFVEGQFFLILGEIGLVGTIIFYWLLGQIIYRSYLVYRAARDHVFEGLSLALMAAGVALIFQSLTTNTFIIVRVMEPFWFVAAIVLGYMHASSVEQQSEGIPHVV